MGICKKCKKKTDLYCFKHKHPICAACLAAADCEHSLCYVGSYSDFLHLSAEEVAALLESTCPTCAEGFTDSKDILRLPCLHLVHQKCLEKIVSELPADTARGGFTCPKCNKPLFSSNDISSDNLASALAARLHDLPWAAALLSTITSPPSTADATTSSSAEASDSSTSVQQPEAPAASGESAPAPSSEAAPSASSSVTVPSPPPSAASAPSPDGEKHSASSLFIQQSKSAAPPSSQSHQHQKPQQRSTVATGVPGVGLFVPPPPPKTQSTEAVPGINSVLPNLPVDSHGEDGSGDEFLNIQIPPLGSRLAARKALPLGGDYGSNRLYDEDDDDKHHNSAFVQVAGLFGLTKRERGRVVVDRKRVIAALVVIALGLFLFIRLLSLMKTNAVTTETRTPKAPTDNIKINDRLD